MNREDFFKWLDTVVDQGIVDWEVAEDFADGTLLIRFTNTDLPADE